MRALLDVNVLIALLDADHADHRSARHWLEREIAHGWASCALTQNGYLRIVSQPRYPGSLPIARAAERLSLATRGEHHAFWNCDLSFLDPARIDVSRVHGARQITDVYLLALAVRSGGRFVTFDHGIPLEAVIGAERRNLVLL